jgi:hypothetical protein
MRPSVLTVFVLSTLAFVSVYAQEGAGLIGATTLNAGYICPSSCVLPNCRCASVSTPGDLNPQDIPQFMTLTFDDSVDTIIWPSIRNVTDKHINPNGCPLSATFYVSTKWTDFWQVQQLYNLGHEIAVHTMNHVGNPPMSEIVGAQAALAAFGGIPKSKINGFRCPFLNYSGDTFKNLKSSGTFFYDSSMPVDPKLAA